MAERMVQVGEIELWTEDLGDPAGETVLLITAVGASGIMWPDELCRALAEGGRHVIRYDNRDSGRSTRVDFETDPYTISDLAADVVGVLHAYGVPAAHLVGFSMGGMIAQTVAIEHADRVASLISWGSTPLGDLVAQTLQGEPVGSLPGSDQKVVEATAFTFRPPEDGEDPVDRFVTLGRAFSGTLEPFDEQAARDLGRRMLAHVPDTGAGPTLNGFLAMAASPDRTEALSRVTAPTLVIHGTADPAVPLAHGEATAQAIPGARLLTIDGLGHDFPATALAEIVPAILEHTAPVDART